MDGSRFDRMTQALAMGITRRRTLLGTAAAAVAGLVGQAGIEAAAAGCVKPGKKGCKGPKNGKCCKGSRCQGGTSKKEGRCKCKGSTKQCGTKCINTKTDSKNCGGCGKKCQGGNTCKGGVCAGALGCKVNNNACEDEGPDFPPCPNTDNEFCFCTVDLAGVSYCSYFGDSFCSDCESNADCGAGFACFAANIGNGCSCDVVPPDFNGNFCAPTSCDIEANGAGVNAAAGRRQPR